MVRRPRMRHLSTQHVYRSYDVFQLVTISAYICIVYQDTCVQQLVTNLKVVSLTCIPLKFMMVKCAHIMHIHAVYSQLSLIGFVSNC